VVKRLEGERVVENERVWEREVRREDWDEI
jgi:hypothetical protein